jgi:hypothetical protein
LNAVRDVFANQRSYFQTPLAGSWNQEINFDPVAEVLLRHLNGNKRMSVLQFEPPSATFLNSLAAVKNVERVGIVERATHLRDWHISNNILATGLEVYDDIFNARQRWDIVFLPLMHEKSGPSFSDILNKARELLNRDGILVFDIKIDPHLNHPYLVSDGSRLLRISTIEDTMREVSQSGLKMLTSIEFPYAGRDAQAVREVLFVTKTETGDQS